jgi:hypothetical protein
MAPEVRRFPARTVSEEVQYNASGRKRKLAGGKDIDLKDCKLFTVSQYSCEVEKAGDGKVHCYEVVRYFRR